jgi:hypothetical protein
MYTLRIVYICAGTYSIQLLKNNEIKFFLKTPGTDLEEQVQKVLRASHNLQKLPGEKPPTSTGP